MFADVAAAGRAVEQIMLVATPALLELMDRTAPRRSRPSSPWASTPRSQRLLIAQSDLPGAAGALEADLILAACESGGATEGYRSEDEEQAELLLVRGGRRSRRSSSWAAGSSTTSAYPGLGWPRRSTAIEGVAAARDLVIGTFGHAGDGNLHPTIIYARGDDEARAACSAAFDDIVESPCSSGAR